MFSIPVHAIDEENPSKILIIRFSSFGDILLTLPLVFLLRRKFPHAEIHYLLNKSFSGIFEAVKADKIRLHLYDRAKKNDELSVLIAKLRAEKFDWIIDLQNNFRSFRVKLFLSGKKFKYRKNRIKRFLFVKFKIGSLSGVHVSQKYISAVFPKDKLNKFVLDQEKIDFTSFAEFQKDHPFVFNGKKNIVVFPGARHHTKMWPMNYYNDLLHTLAQSNEYNLIVGGDLKEAKVINKISAVKEKSVYNLAGKTTVADTIRLVALADLVISNDSAPMHLAAILGKKQISIWGSTVTDFGFFPLNLRAVIMEIGDLPCRPCSHLGYDRCPKGHFKCMKDIKPEAVLNNIYKLLEK